MELLTKKAGESAKEYVRRVLVYNLVNIMVKPGEKIIEKELCEIFQMSRTPIREAILELNKDRLIDIRPKQGTYISLIHEDLVEEVRQLREVLEAEIARIACTVCTSEDVDALRENVIVWKYYIDKHQERKIFELDKKFHVMLYTLCHKTYWHDIVQSVSPHFDRTTVLSFRCQPQAHILQDHEALVDAIEQRDAEQAYRIARQHLQRYHENISAMKQTFPDYFEK